MLSEPTAGHAGTHTLADVLAAIRQGERFLISAHARPDGDAIGSMLACSMLLDQLGKHADLVCADRVPPLYAFLPCAATIRHSAQLDPQEQYDAVILLECDSVDRSGLQSLSLRSLINIDHHAGGRAFAHINWIEPSASAVAEMIYHLAQHAGATITAAMATCLYTALLTDTGSFCYPGTGAHTFTLAQELAGRGAEPAAIAAHVYFSNPPSKMRLLGAALSTLSIEDRLAWLSVSLADMQHCRASDEDCEGIVNYAIGIAGVDAALLLREVPGGKVRVSLRSKYVPEGSSVDVAAIASAFGGGGHRHASGCTLPGPLSAALARLLHALRKGCGSI